MSGSECIVYRWFFICKQLAFNNGYVIILLMNYTITYYSDAVKTEIDNLPMTLRVRYTALTIRMVMVGANLGEPHTEAFGGGLFELRLKGAEGIARVFYCTMVGRRIVILHSFVKKTQKTPPNERRIAETRLKEIKNVT
jgi:phage-related protein